MGVTGILNFLLGIEVNYEFGGVVLSQKKYIHELLHRNGFENANGLPTPMVTNCKLSANDGNPVEKVAHYRSIVGALQYVVITRPDIAFVVNRSCQFMQAPLETHFQAVKRFTGASWGADVDDRCSTSGYYIYFGGNIVSWSSQKQQVVARSTAEAEYRSVAYATTKMAWLESLLSELHVVSHGKLQVHEVLAYEQVADILTKPLMSQNLNGINPFPGDGAGQSLNIENHEPKHWSYFRKLSQDEFVRKVVLLIDQDHLSFLSPLKNIEGSEYKKSPLKGDESAQVGQNLQVPESELGTLEFWREVDILSKLHHPNVVAFYGVVQDGPGGTLAAVTKFMVKVSLRHVLLSKEAFGMDYLQSKNIVHFDLKCDNLLVNLNDPVRPICKVRDFGLSKIKRNTLVTSGVRRTLPWMARELLNGSSNKVSDKVRRFVSELR
ncbi:hypothetical protein F3Y22_tig00110221pilonHSYRG00062 [Hibiscus syriacus]|uniref:Protein kinase domain-containing protein n=1 Tax=Hibiscus syriacus TaxID=106335 RepID=A0A6A3BBD5_HIBSY|nr:hypothetical protein F3Y22_tig00110221pilonHSYRG00062 [Hibiscus syriacus]